ncbi:hypothetical protein [Streptomyces sp. WMMC940]|uniref:hypothetical protein n=1 Tax=Streptomyces sp. WMMC940 TaxID=3015153 RepID=UPI0022B71074|nr:hypothetical protein [Streptomyces sp. WMMC940]MCZ7456522.1 hypothetical protein [Streptomyces sp. WMMC940]
MNRLLRLMAAITATAVLAGLALIGTAGAASAESRSALQDRRNAYATVPDRTDEHRHERDGRRLRDGRGDRYGHGHWRNGKDGHWYWHGDDRHTYYRYDGHRRARWIDGTWVFVVPDRGHDVDRWYFDQVLDALRNEGHRV